MNLTPTGIEWADFVWNPITGCEKISEGCENCYAHAIHKRFGKGVPFSEIVFHPDRLNAPLRRKKPAVIFVNSMGDLFHEDCKYGHIMRVLEIIYRAAPWHQFIILTKRPENMRKFFKQWQDLSGESLHLFKGVRGPEATRENHPSGRGQLFADMLDTYGPKPEGAAWPTFDWANGMLFWPRALPENLYIGVSAENQQRFDERVPTLCNTPAEHRIVSIEPMLGPVNINDPIMAADMLDWVICGPETGQRARHFDEQWAIDLRDQCRDYGIPFFYKANGGNLGGERCREYPKEMMGNG